MSVVTTIDCGLVVIDESAGRAVDLDLDISLGLVGPVRTELVLALVSLVTGLLAVVRGLVTTLTG